MLVRKSQISSVIKKEKKKVLVKCEKESSQNLQKLKKNLETEHNTKLRELRTRHKQLILQKDNEINRLRKEIEKHHSLYMDLRQREKQLDELTIEVDSIIESMVVKVQESLQPFYRVRAKVEATKRKSDKKHEKVESIFSAVK